MAQQRVPDPITTTSTEGSAGPVKSGNAAPLFETELADDETLRIVGGTLTIPGAAAVPTDLDLVIATPAGPTRQAIVFDGDGATVYIGEEGDPIASYQNTTGGPESVGVYVDNGQFNAGTGSEQTVNAQAEYEVA